VRRMWSDAKKQRLEDCLGDFILNLGIVAKALKLDREECQRREREREEERRPEEEQRVQREGYLRKVEVMKAFNKEWEQSLSLARFAQAHLSQLSKPPKLRSKPGPHWRQGRASMAGALPGCATPRQEVHY